MSDTDTKIFDIISKLQSSKITREDLNLLISKSYILSISFLKSKYQSKLNFLNSENRNIEDIAMDAIVPLFVKNNSGQIGLIRSISTWDQSLGNESDVIYFLSRIIWSRVDQTVTKVLKERDPIFEKVLKTLNVCIKNNGFKKNRYFGTVLVLQNQDANLFGEVIAEENFNKIPEFYFGFKQTELFNNIFKYLITDTKYYPAIPLNLLVKRIKLYHSNRLDSFIGQSFSEVDHEICAKNLIAEGLKSVNKKIERYYLTKNKINKSEAINIYNAFRKISKDFLNGGIHDSLFVYLKDQDESLTREVFYKKYHPIMNYLFINFKKNLTANIRI